MRPILVVLSSPIMLLLIVSARPDGYHLITSKGSIGVGPDLSATYAGELDACAATCNRMGVACQALLFMAKQPLRNASCTLYTIRPCMVKDEPALTKPSWRVDGTLYEKEMALTMGSSDGPAVVFESTCANFTGTIVDEKFDSITHTTEDADSPSIDSFTDECGLWCAGNEACRSYQVLSKFNGLVISLQCSLYSDSLFDPAPKQAYGGVKVPNIFGQGSSTPQLMANPNRCKGQRVRYGLPRQQTSLYQCRAK